MCAGRRVNPGRKRRFRKLVRGGSRPPITVHGRATERNPTARWDYFDGERGWLRLPTSKTGAKSVHLNAPALEILSNLPRFQGNPYIIVGREPGGHLVNLQKPWRRIRKLAGLEDVRLHDLRHSFASVAASGGHSLPIIGRLLGHTQAQTTARYAHLANDPVKAAGEAVAKRISAALAGKSGDVASLPQRKRAGIA